MTRCATQGHRGKCKAQVLRKSRAAGSSPNKVEDLGVETLEGKENRFVILGHGTAPPLPPRDCSGPFLCGMSIISFHSLSLIVSLEATGGCACGHGEPQACRCERYRVLTAHDSRAGLCPVSEVTQSTAGNI